MARGSAGTTIPYGLTFLHVGSMENANVLKYIPTSGTWELILSKPNYIFGAAMLVDLDTFPSC